MRSKYHWNQKLRQRRRRRRQRQQCWIHHYGIYNVDRCTASSGIRSFCAANYVMRTWHTQAIKENEHVWGGGMKWAKLSQFISSALRPYHASIFVVPLPLFSKHTNTEVRTLNNLNTCTYICTAQKYKFKRTLTAFRSNTQDDNESFSLFDECVCMCGFICLQVSVCVCLFVSVSLLFGLFWYEIRKYLRQHFRNLQRNFVYKTFTFFHNLHTSLSYWYYSITI